jgi:cytochrome c peroxidase
MVNSRLPRRHAPALILGLLVAGSVFYACTAKKEAPEKTIAERLLRQVDSFSAISDSLRSAVETHAPESRLQQLFLGTRLAYKRMEWAAEYFDPTAARMANGPPVQEVELSGAVIQPTGLQVIETYLYPAYDTAHRDDLLAQLKRIRLACDQYRLHYANIAILDWQVFDAAKLEVFRIMTLGIVGFDDPLSQKSIPESAAALQGLEDMLAYYPGDSLPFNAAVAYLASNPDFNSFDRARFITDYANPLTTGITALEKNLDIHVIRYNRLLNQDARTLFDTDAFNVNAYVPDYVSFTSPEKIALGKKLFADPTLSSTGTRSCQTCHQPDKAFTDGLVRNTTIVDGQLLPRNTPTLINAALQPVQFADGRVKTLEDQSRNVVQNKAEMHGDMKLSVQRLWQDTAYRRLFATAFPKAGRTAIDTLEVMNAIGSYVRSLVLLNSRFDTYMRGDKRAMSPAELAGFNLFMGKAKCGSCHYMPLFNGTLPPAYRRIETEVIGVPQSLTGKEIDGDPGRFTIVKVESFRHAFKTPTVRNAARTAPYMHNGVFPTLEQVVDFYDRGGGAGLGIKIDNQTLPFDQLHLTPQERDNIIAFIRTLDSH